jgi:N-acetylmuramoyl-L-alanine amidase
MPMLKKLLKFIVLILVLVGIFYGVMITVEKNNPGQQLKKIEDNLLSKLQTQMATAEKIYTYGKAISINGNIANVSKDNLESAKLYITDGLEFEKTYRLNNSFDENKMNFYAEENINTGIILDHLECGEYYMLLRLKLNNSIDPRYYSLRKHSNFKNIEYYTMTKDGKNKKIEISYEEKTYKDNNYDILKLIVTEVTLPEDVFDIVIDAGHGGMDSGENLNGVTESDLMLEYAKVLKNKLEEKGYKVKLTRDDNNTDIYTHTNMYDSNGRISIACESKAKLMISLHINDGGQSNTGFEIYSPTKVNLDFAKSLAKSIDEKVSITYSNNSRFKKEEGVYVRSYTKREILDLEVSAKNKGYEPYPITVLTPYHYTIREVGGIATEAYVDGRNTAYNRNEYYNSNQGIECYQLELGYIKNDLEIITNEKENYINAITDAICNNY